jgi:signal transduction histidine kinase
MSTLDFTKRQSFGLIGMRERVNQLHGELAMENTGLKGTRITIRLPLFF